MRLWVVVASGSLAVAAAKLWDFNYHATAAICALLATKCLIDSRYPALRRMGDEMPTPQVLLIAAAAAGLWWGGTSAWHGIKKAGHTIGCVVTTGHRCPKK